METLSLIYISLGLIVAGTFVGTGVGLILAVMFGAKSRRTEKLVRFSVGLSLAWLAVLGAARAAVIPPIEGWYAAFLVVEAIVISYLATALE
jgi:hypothetical protein